MLATVQSSSSPPGSDQRTAFTLVEVLLVIALMAILVGLIAPAIISARETARRSWCASNLRQIGISIQIYHDIFECFPPGRIKGYDLRFAGPNPPCSSPDADKSLHVFLLPLIEQLALYNAINSSLSIVSAENSTVHGMSVPQYACPSDPDAGPARILPPALFVPLGAAGPAGAGSSMSFTSYSGCLGSLEALALPLARNHCSVSPIAIAENDGLFNDLTPLRISAVADGLSQTISVGEKSITLNGDLDIIRDDLPLKYGWYVVGNWGDTLFSTTCPPNSSSRIALRALDAQVRSASSLHPGGVNVLLADGSARFVSDRVHSWPIDPSSGLPIGIRRNPSGWWDDVPARGVWQALSTRAGGEPVAVD